MSSSEEKVICSRARKCKEDKCDHIRPHEVETWMENGVYVDCTFFDDCEGHKIWCEPVCDIIDFNMDDGDFLI